MEERGAGWGGSNGRGEERGRLAEYESRQLIPSLAEETVREAYKIIYRLQQGCGAARHAQFTQPNTEQNWVMIDVTGTAG